jgi:hypothetical protein
MSAPIDLEAIRDKFVYDATVSESLSGKDLYGRLADLTSEVIRIDKKSDDQPIPDLVTNLRIEIADLKARLEALSQTDRIVEDTRTALRQREEAEDADKTAVRLPVYAGKLMAELVQLRQLHGQHP